MDIKCVSFLLFIICISNLKSITFYMSRDIFRLHLKTHCKLLTKNRSLRNKIRQLCKKIVQKIFEADRNIDFVSLTLQIPTGGSLKTYLITGLKTSTEEEGPLWLQVGTI